MTDKELDQIQAQFTQLAMVLKKHGLNPLEIAEFFINEAERVAAELMNEEKK